jgi:hypothetical protein
VLSSAALEEEVVEVENEEGFPALAETAPRSRSVKSSPASVVAAAS